MKILSFFLLTGLLFLSQSCNKKNSNPVNITNANFGISGYEVPVPTTITFTNISQNATSYLWDFGDGSTSTQFNPAHTYASAGTYSLKLTAIGPTGQNDICKQVDVEQLLTGHSAFSYFLDRCTGIPVNIAFRSLNPGSSNFSWDFGNGGISVINSPFISYVLTGDYTIRFSSRINGVQDTVTRILRIQ